MELGESLFGPTFEKADGSPGHGVHHRFNDGNTSSPSVKEIECFITDGEDWYQRVVPDGEQECGDEVEDRQDARSTAKVGQDLFRDLLAKWKPQTIRDVGGHIKQQEDGLVPSWYRAHVDMPPANQHQFSVVSDFAQWCINEVFLDAWPNRALVMHPILLVFATPHGQEQAQVRLRDLHPSIKERNRQETAEA